MGRTLAAGVAMLGAAFLAGCNPNAQDSLQGEMPTPPADAPSSAPAGPNFSGPINAVGTEPFWQVEIRPTGLKLSGPDRHDLVLANPGPRIQGDTAVWDAEGLEGRPPMKITLEARDCSDGMSDLHYPFAAHVESTGEVLNGCAAPLDAMPKKPAP